MPDFHRNGLIVEVSQKLSLYDNDHSGPLDHYSPEDNLNEAHLLFCKAAWLSLSIPVREIISIPLRVPGSCRGGPWSRCLLLLIKQMWACPIALLRLNPTPEWIHQPDKRKAYEHMLHRTQKAFCLLNPFPALRGEKSLFVLELRIEGAKNEDWMPC